MTWTSIPTAASRSLTCPPRRAPRSKRSGVLTSLWARVLATGREPMVSRIRLAWWREALERLDRAPPPAEPVLQALAAHLLPAGVAGADWPAMEEGWEVLLADGPLDAASAAAYAAARGGALFRHSARLLGDPAISGRGGRAGCWALVDLARRSADPARARAALDARRAGHVRDRNGRSGCGRSACSPLLARRDVERGPGRPERQGAPARMMRMLAIA